MAWPSAGGRPGAGLATKIVVVPRKICLLRWRRLSGNLFPVKINRALLSVSDKTGLIPFAQALAAKGVELISTGGTAKTLREAGLAVKDISEHTGFPEMLDGRVKTLHPKVHGGLLYIRGNATHEAAVKEHGILPIDLVVVNLYPHSRRPGGPSRYVSLHDAIENIDIRRAFDAPHARPRITTA